ncbi:MAG TPA: hypothetical protein VK980_16505 [Sphingomonas sp.]|nr:hypothetical protein [Sphingomonas sp.]
MKRVWPRLAALLAACLALPALAQAPATPTPALELVLTSVEHYQANGRDWTRFHYDVANKQALPPGLFASAPTLPPCGLNTRASRSWVDFYDMHGKRLYGFCALAQAADLATIWFSVPEDQVPPSWVYIEIVDRQTGTRYKSNLAETAL